MNEFHWTTEGYVKILRDNLKQLNESVGLYSQTLPPEKQRVILSDAARFASEVAALAVKAWEKAKHDDLGAHP